MKKSFINTMSILTIIVTTIIFILNVNDIRININNLLEFKSTIENNIITIGILRIVLKIILILYSIFTINYLVNLIKCKKIIELKKSIKIQNLIGIFIGILLQILNLSDLKSNYLLFLLVTLQIFILILILNKNKKRLFLKLIFIIYYLVIIGIFSFSYLFCHKFEVPTLKHGTSKYPVINKNINTLLWQMSSESDFFYNSVYNKKKKNNYDLIPIPGINYTDTVTIKDNMIIETCTSMTPQGIVITDKYIYISAYCYTHNHNSVIYQLDKNTKKHIKTIVLSDATHAGGIAYDEENKILWIATKKYSTNVNTDTTATVSCITQDVIDNYNFELSKQPIRYYKTFQTAFTNTSFITYHEGYIYTGLFTEKEETTSKVAKLKLTDDGDIRGTTLDTEPEKYFYIPGLVQGMTFIDDKVLYTTSYGLNKSKILVYYYNENIIDFIKTKPIKEIETPSMLEQIYPNEDNLYMVFESSAYAYRYTPGVRIDHVISMNKKILN